MFRTIIELGIFISFLTGGSLILLKKSHEKIHSIFSDRAKRGFSSIEKFNRQLFLKENSLKKSNKGTKN